MWFLLGKGNLWWMMKWKNECISGIIECVDFDAIVISSPAVNVLPVSQKLGGMTSRSYRAFDAGRIK